MTKFIYFSECLVPVDRILSITTNVDSSFRLNLFIENLSNLIYEDFESKEDRDARFEELKKMLCSEYSDIHTAFDDGFTQGKKYAESIL